MEVHIISRNYPLEDNLKEYIQKKLEKLSRFYSRIYRCEVILDEEKLNKTESAYLDELRCDPQYVAIHVQSLTLKLGDDCRYTPDFVTIDKEGKCKCHETKGFWRDDARVKIKAAARMYRWMEFVAVTKQKGDWQYEQIRP